MNRIILLAVSILLSGCGDQSIEPVGNESVYSDIAPDEFIQFFRTAAWLDETSQQWQVPIHGWIYEPQDSFVRKAAFETALKSEFDLEPSAKTDANLTRRLNLMIADNERGKQVVISVADQKHTLPPSEANGHFETTLLVPASEVEKFAAGDAISYSAVMRTGDARQFSGEALLVGPTGVSIISDIDDTIKVSDVTDKKKLLENTFLLNFRAAPGMAQLYRDWSSQGASLHFVSSSPWQLYAPLAEFLDEAGFPPSTMSLKPVRFRDETLPDLFKKGTETKPVAIEKILNAYPARQFVLVGDSGEQDPEVYASITQKHPDQILKIFIRNVTQESADNERFKDVFLGIDSARWQLFDDPITLSLP